VRDLTIITDYFVITNGNSNTQVKAIAGEVEYELKQQGITPERVEGHQSNNWILLDFNSVIVHIFLGETREFYSLEHLWNDGEQLDVQAFLEENHV